jgi:predicted RNA-binding protein with PUA-like domain
MHMQYWLFKSEPDEYSIDDLRQEQVDHWDGVRNYQARNMMRDQMKTGDLAFFYHSNCTHPGVVGMMRIAREGYPDHTAFDPNDKHYDPHSDPDRPRWYRVDVRFERKLKRTIALRELKAHPELAELALVRKGNRLSIMPLTAQQWDFVLGLESAKT